MKGFIKSESGSVLAMTLIVMLVLGILGTVLLNISLAENKFANHNEDKMQAYYIARSGAQAVAEYMVQDNNDDAVDIIGFSTVANDQIGGGEFSLDVQEDATDSNTINIVSTGTYNGITQTAKIQVTKTSEGIGGLFNHAIVAKNNISVLASGQGINIDGTIATIDGTINLGNGYSKGAEENVALVLPDVVIPEDDEIDKKFGVINSNLDLPTNDTSPLDGKYIYYSTGINLQNEIIRVTSGVVHLFVDGNVDVGPNSALTANVGAKLYIYVHGDRTVELWGSTSNNNVYIYAPDSDISWNNANPTGSIFGGLVGENVMIREQVTIIHNPDMANDFYFDTSNEGINFTGYKWID